ncbi:MAG: hypothetical protein KJN61_07460 [Gammaproteobacteria bacterium]|nr:hypothetical protein [Gammaproteobacteria bacterium]MBT8076290.1 hypothetical protein [Gammaproteobacteria bacterium]
MTSYREPDYDVGIRVTPTVFQAIAGIAFDVSVTIGEDQHNVSGMLIIPQGNDYPETSSSATAWLWSEDSISASVDTVVTITLGEPCDPMLLPEEESALAIHTGTFLEGVIKRKRGALSEIRSDD